jgi:phage gp46-like protein
MFDLALTEKGDVLFQNDTKQKMPLVISLCPREALKITLSAEGFLPLEQSNNALKISFDCKTDVEYKKAIMLNEHDSKIQAIKIRLQTTLGDIAGNTDIGSKLELVKHKESTDESVLSSIKTYVTEAIADIISDPEIIIKPVVSISNGYEQKVIIYIYENEMLIYKYDLKG